MLIKRLLDSLFGTLYVETDVACAERCLNILHKDNLSLRDIKKNDEKFSFEIALDKRKKVVSALDKSGIKDYIIKGKGLPFLIKKYRKRYGIAIGLVLFFVMLKVSSLFVWQIEFSGNEYISDVQVEKELLDAGFGVGSYIPKVDFYSLCNTFLRQTEDYSFVSVNIEGTTAKVELRERNIPPEKSEYKASNIVAKYSGQIESMTVYSGQTVVEKESVVKEGELLVSGFCEKTSGFDIVRSTGSVYAYVTRRFEIEVPFEKNIKEYSGNRQVTRGIKFFGKNISFPWKSDKKFEKYDETVDSERLVLFDRVKLPLVLTWNVRKEYTEKTVMLTNEEAAKEAELQLSRILTEELYDSEVLERSVKEEVTESSYKLICEVYCLTDIALEKEIEVN